MEHKNTLRVGRSHGIQLAERNDVGPTFARFYAEMDRNPDSDAIPLKTAPIRIATGAIFRAR